MVLFGVIRLYQGTGNVLRYVYEYRPRTSGLTEVEGLPHNSGKLLSVFDQVAVFDDRVGNSAYVRFLEGVEAQVPGGRLSGNDDHRNRVHLSRQNACNGVGCSGSRGYQHHCRSSGRPGIPVGHVGGTLLVPGKNEGAGRAYQRVKNGNSRSTGMTKDVFDSLLLDDIDDDFRAGLFGTTHRKPPSAVLVR